MVIQTLDVAQQVERQRLPSVALSRLGEMGADRVGLPRAKDTTCTISVAPTFSPSIAASAETSAIKPRVAKEVIMRAVAVLL
jgi:hypothetical protein